MVKSPPKVNDDADVPLGAVKIPPLLIVKLPSIFKVLETSSVLVKVVLPFTVTLPLMLILGSLVAAVAIIPVLAPLPTTRLPCTPIVPEAKVSVTLLLTGLIFKL